jgi:hypothetical protein
MEKESMIYIKRGDRQELKHLMNCKDSTVSQALRFKSNSLLSYRIRHAAMNLLHGFLL